MKPLITVFKSDDNMLIIVTPSSISISKVISIQNEFKKPFLY